MHFYDDRDLGRRHEPCPLIQASLDAKRRPIGYVEYRHCNKKLVCNHARRTTDGRTDVVNQPRRLTDARKYRKKAYLVLLRKDEK